MTRDASISSSRNVDGIYDGRGIKPRYLLWIGRRLMEELESESCSWMGGVE